MASTPTPEALEVRRKGKRRLVGAFAIVIAMVVFLPMILDPAPRQQKQDLSLAIPAKDDVAPLPPPVEKPAAKDEAKPAASESAKAAPDVPKAAASDVPKAVEPAKPAAAAPATAAPALAPAKVETSPKAAAAPAPAAAPAKAADAPKLEGFAVQIGAFKDDARLKVARDKLIAAKVQHYTERLATSSGELTRLRAGPYPTREAADKVVAQLKRSGIDGKVVPLP